MMMVVHAWMSAEFKLWGVIMDVCIYAFAKRAKKIVPKFDVVSMHNGQ